ncbi:MAG: hypothetical protein WD404_09410 [Solirubrobacterales bacterium]
MIAHQPQYDPETVAGVILKEIVELHPKHLTVDELCARIVVNCGDEREIETATRAIGDLRDSGLLTPRADEIAEPTPATLRTAALLTG